MSYRLHQSDRIEFFLQEKRAVFRKDSLFGPSLWFVVQNRNMGEWLKLRLTDWEGITAGFTSLFPEQAIRQFADYFDHPWKEEGSKTVLHMDNLKVVLYKKLEEIRRNRPTRYRVLLEFLSEDKVLYDIANVMAGLFYRYGMNCFDLVSAWERDVPFASRLPGETRNHEAWQRCLWQELFGPESPYILLSRILVHIREENLPYQGPPGRLVLFGSSFLGDAGLNFFSYLSRYLEVDHFLLTPSRSFLAGSPEEISSEWSHLTSLIQGVSEFFKNNPPRDFAGYEYISGEFPETLLGQLQQSLWEDRFTDPQGEPDLFEEARKRSDDSLRFFSFAGNWRQVEEAKNKIITLLERDPDLALTDIALLAPDINDFAPYIEALFGRGEVRLPYNLIDLKSENQSVFIEGFLQLLELPGSRFNRTELFSLFNNPCFARAMGIKAGEADRWRDVCHETGIVWGMDGDHLGKLNLPSHENNRWERGFDRLLDGMLYYDSEERENRPVVFPDESFNVSLGKLIMAVRSLYEDFFSQNSRKLPLESWIPQLEQLMEKYLLPRPDNLTDRGDREQIKAVFRNINNLMEGLNWLREWDDPLFPWHVFKSLLLELIGKNTLKKGGYLTSGISCSSLKPLRAVPFKVVILLGMDYGVFPGRDGEYSFDLTDLAKPTVDLSRQGGDRFSFLEAFTSAREKFWVFYNGRNNVTGEITQPSVTLSELSELVTDHHLADSADLTVYEPLQPYDPSYFDGSRDYPSRDSTAYLQAKALQEKDRKQASSFRIWDSIVSDESDEMSLNDLIAFFRNPLKSYGRKSLRLYYREEEEAEGEPREPVEPALFEDSLFYRELLDIWSDRGNLDSDSLNEYAALWWDIKVQEGQITGYDWDRPGRRSFVEKGQGFLDRLNMMDHSLLGSGHGKSRVLARSLAIPGSDSLYYDPLTLDIGEERIRLNGETAPLYGTAIPAGVDYVYGKKAGVRYHLPHLLNYLILSREETEGIKAYHALLAGPLVSVTSGWCSPETDRGDTLIPVAGGDEILKKIVALYRDNLSRPLPFYPSLLDRTADLIKKGQMEPDDISRRWPRIWQDGVNAFNGFHDIKSCPYRELFFPEPPEWDDRMESLFRDILPLLTPEEKKKSRSK